MFFFQLLKAVCLSHFPELCVFLILSWESLCCPNFLKPICKAMFSSCSLKDSITEIQKFYWIVWVFWGSSTVELAFLNFRFISFASFYFSHYFLAPCSFLSLFRSFRTWLLDLFVFPWVLDSLIRFLVSLLSAVQKNTSFFCLHIHSSFFPSLCVVQP